MSETPILPFPLDDPSLTQAILARTSGNPCRRFEALACDLVDGTLSPRQARLAQGHLEHCPTCRSLVSSLEELKAGLPSFALLAPDPAFTLDILQETLPTRLPTFRNSWIRLMRRPRICLEAAYLGTVAGLITLHAPLPRPYPHGTALVSSVAPALHRIDSGRHLLHAQALSGHRRATQVMEQQTGKGRTLWDHGVARLRRWWDRIPH